MTNFYEAVVILSKSMSFLVKAEIQSKYFAEFGQAPEASIQNAMKDAHQAQDAMYQMGQMQVVTGVMEGIEASMWLISPEEEYEVHEQMLIDLFTKVAKWEAPEPAPEVVDPVLIAQKASLEKLMAS